MTTIKNPGAPVLLRWAVWLAMLIACAFASAAEPALTGQSGVTLRHGIKIPVRDGVHLNANLFLPAQSLGPQPVVFVLTPYTTDRYYIDDCIYYARGGYGCAIVDVRGRGDSEGRFVPFEDDGRDGYDVVEWLARQSWSNGKVAMFGLSYSGFTQWTVLKELPPHLASIVPTAAAYPGYDFPLWPGNIFHQWDIMWLTGTTGAAAGSNLITNEELSTGTLQQLYLGNHAFAQWDEVAGNSATVFQKWLAHPYRDAYWDSMVPTVAEYQQIHVPVLTITGHYDADQHGALYYYGQHMTHGNALDTSRHYLVIGPWNHPLTHRPAAEFEGLKFGPASVVDMQLLHKQWFDWVLKDGPRPDFLTHRVAYYVSGLEQWKHADRLEEIGRAAGPSTWPRRAVRMMCSTAVPSASCTQVARPSMRTRMIQRSFIPTRQSGLASMCLNVRPEARTRTWPTPAMPWAFGAMGWSITPRR
jgi:uncharacterized protein